MTTAASEQPSMHRVLEVLQEMATREAGKRQDAAATLAGLIRVVATSPLAAMVFDPTLPPVRLDASGASDMIVITTTGLKLPPKAAFDKQEYAEHLELEKEMTDHHDQAYGGEQDALIASNVDLAVMGLQGGDGGDPVDCGMPVSKKRRVM